MSAPEEGDNNKDNNLNSNDHEEDEGEEAQPTPAPTKQPEKLTRVQPRKKSAKMRRRELNTIRRLIVEGHSPAVIQEYMQLSAHAYLSLLSQLGKEDPLLVAVDEKTGKELLSVDVQIMRERINMVINMVTKIMRNDKEPTVLRMKAGEMLAELAYGSLKLSVQGPHIVNSFTSTVKNVALGNIEAATAVFNQPDDKNPVLQDPAVFIDAETDSTTTNSEEDKKRAEDLEFYENTKKELLRDTKYEPGSLKRLQEQEAKSPLDDVYDGYSDEDAITDHPEDQDQEEGQE